MHAFQMEPLFRAKYEQLLDNLTERVKTGKPIDFKEYVMIKLPSIITHSCGTVQIWMNGGWIIIEMLLNGIDLYSSVFCTNLDSHFLWEVSSSIWWIYSFISTMRRICFRLITILNLWPTKWLYLHTKSIKISCLF